MRRVIALLALLASPLVAQEPPPGSPPPARPEMFRLPVKLSGEATSSADLYHDSGIPSRRPGQAWRM